MTRRSVHRLHRAFPPFLIAGLTALLPTAPGIAFGQALDSDSPDMEEVVVTARKLAEPVRKVPVAVTPITAMAIEDLGVQSLEDIAKITAGLVFDSELGRGSNRPVIRGQANILGASGVSYFVDGVYVGGAIDDYDLNEVERIEVVKGPQSALYGRNTYSGAINIITRSPGETPGARFKAGLASDGQTELSAALQGPLAPGWGGRVALRHFERDGPFRNAWDGGDVGAQQSDSIAAVLQWDPNDRLALRARAYYNERDDGQPALTRTDTSDNNCFPDTGSGLYAGAGRYYCGVIPAREIDTDWPRQAPGARETSDDLNLSLRLDYRIGEIWSLTSITGYNDNDSHSLTDTDYTDQSFNTVNFTKNGFPFSGFEDGPPFTYAWVPSPAYSDFTFAERSRADDVSQEVRLGFERTRVRGLFGVYYLRQSSFAQRNRSYPEGALAIAQEGFAAEQQRMVSVCDANPLCEAIFPLGQPALAPLNRNQNHLDTTNTAVFGLVSAQLAPTWRLTLEGRWQKESVSQLAIAQNLGEPPSATTRASESFTAFLPRLTLDWQPGANTLLYALFAEGTKPGGLNTAAAIEAGLPAYGEENVRGIEVGAKSLLANGRLRANVAVFRNRVEGYQLTQAVQGAGRAITATVNAGDARINGVELEIQYRPVDVITATLNYAWTDSEFTRGVDANQGVLEDVADNGAADCSTGNQFPELPGCTSKYGSIVGKSIPRTAEHQWFADVEWRAPLGTSAWDGYAGVSWSFESSKFSQVHNLAETGDASVLNARIGLVRDAWSLQVYGRNLTGEDAWLNVLRYLEPGLTRAFGLSARRDTWYGISLIYTR